MSTPALKPCPFCGGVATLEDERLLWVARCTACGACVLGDRAPEPEQEMPEGYWEPFRRSAVDRWNRRAAPAAPVGEGPSDQELGRFLAERHRARMESESAFGCPDFDGAKARAARIADTRAVLARWGQPTPQPIPVSERLPGEVGELVAPAQAVVPVAVSERPWERPGWLDREGRCWFLSSRFSTWSLDSPPVALTRGIGRCLSLPAHAIPLPQAGEGRDEHHRFTLGFGALYTPIDEQLRAQGLKLDMDPLQRAHLQRDADEVTRLRVRCILTEAESDKARKRILQIIKKQAIPL